MLPFARVSIIGLGLIGSSLARAARELNLAGEIIACDASPAVRARVTALGLADLLRFFAATGHTPEWLDFPI